MTRVIGRNCIKYLLSNAQSKNASAIVGTYGHKPWPLAIEYLDTWPQGRFWRPPLVPGAPGGGFEAVFRGIVIVLSRPRTGRFRRLLLCFLRFAVGFGLLAHRWFRFYFPGSPCGDGAYRGCGGFALPMFLFRVWYWVFFRAAVTCLCLVIRVCHTAPALLN